MSKTICVCGRKGPKYPECCDSDGNFLPGHGPRADRMSDPKPLTPEEERLLRHDVEYTGDLLYSVEHVARLLAALAAERAGDE